MSEKEKILYTLTDEAPALATYSFLPVVECFTKAAGVSVETRDISLAGRILAQFGDMLDASQRVNDDLEELGALAKTAEANIIKLPNISASTPQIKAAVKELQEQGYPLPDYPDIPENAAQREVRARYDRVKGSAVNPVLREGNSDRRAARAVKAYARKNPHTMGAWSADSKSHVSSMAEGDFFANERSFTARDAMRLRIEFVPDAGEAVVLKDGIDLLPGEIFDGSFMSVASLRAFLREAIDDAKAQGVLFSLHLKATMMKVSDPILFGHAVSEFLGPVVERHREAFERLEFDPRSGLADLDAKLEALPEADRRPLQDALTALLEARPDLAMVDSDRGVTNLHVPSDIIIDASMPAAIRASGKMWNKAGALQDMKAVIPDRSYAGIYQATIEDCKANGAFDPQTMGSVSNIGLMAQKAEEYGSHDKTFEIPSDGRVRVVEASGEVLMEHRVAAGDIWRGCQVKDAAIRDWVKLAVGRARETGVATIFWLDRERAHDAELIRKVEQGLDGEDTTGLDIRILAPVEATRVSLERMRKGEDTVSVTGNVLRDYLTDLFPILELGTSAKMLSIVPLMQGGGLFETGAGGSAPKHVQQFLKENHLRWDSLGEFLALQVSLEHLAKVFGNDRAALLARALDAANAAFLDANKSPSRKVGELDNRGSHYYLARYWAEAIAAQEDDAALRERFGAIAEALVKAEATILDELNGVQGVPVTVGGYYRPDPRSASRAMRPSPTLNSIIDGGGVPQRSDHGPGS